MNEQLQLRSQQLDHANAFQEAVLSGLRAAVAVVDRDLRVRSWEEKVEDLWGLREDEVVGKSIFDLDIGLPMDELRPAIRACLRGETDVPEVEVAATNRRGKAIRCSVICTPLRQESRVEGVILLMELVAPPRAGNSPEPIRDEPKPRPRRRKR